MAGIGRWPVPVPDKVKVSVQDGKIAAQGAKGQLEVAIDPCVSVEMKDGGIVVARSEETRRAKAIHGMTRKMIANMVEGVSKGFTRTLEISGVGYRAEAVGKVGVQFSLGYSHPILFQLPEGIQAKIERQTVITLEGIDKQLLGEVAVAIRRLRPPDPYKAKGIKYAEETIRRKAGKTAGAK
ncbi:MAG: 50S ribosomal protein L6 [Deltaproteobacteria bacterium]|nr:50S ribosomal protein L6 [Deltaproteobacteria bacterium]